MQIFPTYKERYVFIEAADTECFCLMLYDFKCKYVCANNSKEVTHQI